MTPGLELTFPWVLAALPLLLLLPRARGWLLRVLGLALLVVALAGPTVSAPGGRLAVLIDVSNSVGDRAVTLAEEFGGDWRRNAQTYFFAGDTGEARDSTSQTDQLRPEVTDLARALQVAAAGGAERILLLSDGAESSGNALLALPPVPVDTYRVAPEPNARIAALLVPEQATPGETVEAVAVLESDRAAMATLFLSVSGNEAAAVEIELAEGRSVVPFQFAVPTDTDAHLNARLEVDYQQSRADDSRSAEISVSEEEPVLVIGDPALAGMLRSQEFEVIEGGAAEVQAPLAYSAVIVREHAASFTQGQLAELRSYVENGGGLMMTGGPESFGFGGWYRTPVEEVLPVDTDLRTEVEIPLVALVIVLDRSQSMATGNPSKIELAKEGALGVVELAYQDDLLGMVTFSDDYEWTFRLRPATGRGKREMLSSILSLSTGGGTILEPGYRAALDALRGSEAALKHVIILSDGKLYDGQGPFGQAGAPPDFSLLAAGAAAEGITTSAIAIGRSADFEVLERIASAGNGRYHSALDVSTLPNIFTSEALTATRSLLRDEPTEPIARAHPLSPFDGPLPAIDAYIASAPKPTAELLLIGQHDEPVLAVRRHGLGRSAAFTSDLNGWSGALGRGPELPTMLGSVVRWLQAEPASYAASVAREGNEIRVTVDAVEDGQYVNGARLEARLNGNRVGLEQVAPGRYEGQLPGDVDEGNVLVVEANDVVARAPLRTPHREFDSAGGPELLSTISARTGGETLDSPETYSPSLRSAGRPLWPELLMAALVLFLAELLLRRFARERPAGAGRAEPSASRQR
ncbi:MAG: VWA domain-containing protein [Trueperaceae bacterium]